MYNEVLTYLLETMHSAASVCQSSYVVTLLHRSDPRNDLKASYAGHRQSPSAVTYRKQATQYDLPKDSCEGDRRINRCVRTNPVWEHRAAHRVLLGDPESRFKIAGDQVASSFVTITKISHLIRFVRLC
jgi:hypothetical protein